MTNNILVRGLSALYWMLGGFVIIAAVTSFLVDMTLIDMLSWVSQHFGKSFTALYLVLVGVGVLSIAQLYAKDIGVNNNAQHCRYWRECGLQAANGISTLALTFTLLGISLGIGTLADTPLTPSTVQNIIGELTGQFSIAFMTTVIGLPTAAAIRAWLAIRCAKMSTLSED
ncbi:hypothetical protein [Agaribacter marinus]|nr:hypothetical protein [Agaribacter marinus]